MTPIDDDDDLGLPPGDTSERTAALSATVHALRHRACGGCGQRLCGHDALLAVVLGYKDAPRCSTCIAADLREPAAALRERSWQWVRRRECFLRAWHEAGTDEGFGPVDRPACLFAGGVANREPLTAASPMPAPGTPPAAAGNWDAGDLGCGDLVLELRYRLRELPAGSVLHVTARDPAAPVDLPAWCGLCGHTLRHANHPDYWIERKRD